MKNKMIYALGAMMLVGVTSCDLTEKPSSFYEKDTYFVTEGKAQMAVVGIYDCLETTDYYGQNIMPFFGSDDMFMVREPVRTELAVTYPTICTMLLILGLLVYGDVLTKLSIVPMWLLPASRLCQVLQKTKTCRKLTGKLDSSVPT